MSELCALQYNGLLMCLDGGLYRLVVTSHGYKKGRTAAKTNKGNEIRESERAM
jgi:hypothetical protein